MPLPKKKTTKSVSEPSLLYIEWIDAAVESGWTDEMSHHAHFCRSVGWLVKETKQEVVLAADISTDNMPEGKYDTNRRIAIPKAWIKVRKKLETNERKARTTRNTP